MRSAYAKRRNQGAPKVHLLFAMRSQDSETHTKPKESRSHSLFTKVLPSHPLLTFPLHTYPASSLPREPFDNPTKEFQRSRDNCSSFANLLLVSHTKETKKTMGPKSQRSLLCLSSSEKVDRLEDGTRTLRLRVTGIPPPFSIPCMPRGEDIYPVMQSQPQPRQAKCVGATCTFPPPAATIKNSSLSSTATPTLPRKTAVTAPSLSSIRLQPTPLPSASAVFLASRRIYLESGNGLPRNWKYISQRLATVCGWRGITLLTILR